MKTFGLALPTKTRALALALLTLPFASAGVAAQEQAIAGFTVDASGRARIQVVSSADQYYVLHARPDSAPAADEPVSITLGQDGMTTLTEPLAAYPQSHYRVTAHALAAPGDLDRDGIDDLAELRDFGRLSPFNAAPAIAIRDGTVAIPDRATFETLSYQGPEVLIDRHLTDLQFVKFYLLDMNTDNPQVYFMNTKTHRAHGSFARAIGIRQGGRQGDPPGTMRGEIVYHPQVRAPSGAMGIYRFEFEPNDRYPFAEVQKANEVIATNMPFLRNDLAYYPMPNAALPRYHQEKALYDASRVAILLEQDIYADIQYIPLNLAEGYGLLRVMDPNERPHPRDIVLYEALPNELSRVAGIITTVPQTPLSHVNLRAIQDKVPNAFIAGARDNPLIASLVGKHIYYRVGQRDYEIREASLAEVEAFYADRRPAWPQVPVRDLSQTSIAPLSEVSFADWTRFGVKAANMATLLSFGFPAGTLRDGFAVPFYFYDAFMEHNGFYDEVRALLDDPDFQSDYDVQEARLDELRRRIRAAEMPEWMLEDLADMQAAFPAGMPIRCRSSTNNEDLPGFSGAGLYDSYTQHPHEGHIAKSIKQVYASLWTFRAFEERQFHRIDHFRTAMGVLVHQNFEDERANGVGVTFDPFYGSENSYYLNSQLGEDLVTNPEALSIPEEVLLGAAPGSGHTLVRPSNQVPPGERLLSEAHLEAMRVYLGVIEERFRDLYAVSPGQPFGMEIEYKVTVDGILAIKQARPWVFEGPAATAPRPVFLPLALRPVGAGGQR